MPLANLKSVTPPTATPGWARTLDPITHVLSPRSSQRYNTAASELNEDFLRRPLRSRSARSTSRRLEPLAENDSSPVGELVKRSDAYTTQTRAALIQAEGDLVVARRASQKAAVAVDDAFSDAQAMLDELTGPSPKASRMRRSPRGVEDLRISSSSSASSTASMSSTSPSSSEQSQSSSPWSVSNDVPLEPRPPSGRRLTPPRPRSKPYQLPKEALHWLDVQMSITRDPSQVLITDPATGLVMWDPTC